MLELFIREYCLEFFADAVVLYHDQSLIFKEGWKGREMFILVYGQ